jgi:hypothetical protein
MASQVVDKTIRSESEKHESMTWPVRLKRAFDIDIKVCEACGGAAKVIACIDDPGVINKILLNMQSHDSHQPLSAMRRKKWVKNQKNA